MNTLFLFIRPFQTRAYGRKISKTEGSAQWDEVSELSIKKIFTIISTTHQTDVIFPKVSETMYYPCATI